MPKNPTKTATYHLIEAGQLARTALVRPLLELGLEAGDDALLFALQRDTALSDTELGAVTGLNPPHLLPRLERLIRLDLITRADTVETVQAGSRLTEKGAALRDKLMKNWRELDEALLGELKPKHQKRIKKILERFVGLLDF